MVGYKGDYYPNMPNAEYWELRAKENLSKCFGTTAKVEKYLTNLYRRKLKEFIKDYNKLMEPYVVDGEVDTARLNKALTYDRGFQKKIKRFEKEIEQFAIAANAQSQSRIFTALKDAYKQNYDLIANQFGVSLSLLDKRAVEAAVRTPFTTDGREFSERVWQNVNSMHNELRQTLSESIAKGESIQKTTRKFKQIFGNTTYNTQRIIRTETLAIYAKSAVESYKDIGIDELEILSESNACAKCAEFSGKRVALRKAQVGVNIPPIHPNCKCCVKPIVERRIDNV